MVGRSLLLLNAWHCQLEHCVTPGPLCCLLCTRPSSSLSAREKVVGWYSTGPKLREADLDINALIAKFCDNPHLAPVFVICEMEVSLCYWSGPKPPSGA